MLGALTSRLGRIAMSTHVLPKAGSFPNDGTRARVPERGPTRDSVELAVETLLSALAAGELNAPPIFVGELGGELDTG
eukprot:1190418-Prorocentrum_minimum.AAC.1